ncbi:MAG: galactose ABC transporter substrate-binding protein [Lachnospiraceae bacterium]|nr:galactose ABC transporter substrate-binding protein [Lachnospiraceae bacterium]
MKKKLLAALLCLAMAATMVVGCGGGEAEAPAATEEPATEEAGGVAEEVEATVDEDALVAVFWYTFSDTYLSSVRTALNAELDALGVAYQDYDGNGNQTTQNEQIDTAIQTGATCLVVNVVTAGAVDVSQAIVDKASAAGLPVIFFNRSIEGEGEEGTVLGSYDNCAFVGTDAPEAGHMQGKMIGEYLVANYDTVDLNGDGQISYAMFMGQLGNAEAIARTQYGVEDANAVLVEAGKPELVYFDAANTDKYQVDQDGNWSATAAQAYMQTNLSQYSEANGNMIELVICNNDGMAEGAISALQDAGYNKEGATVIPVFGVDATDAAKALIAQGAMIGTIKQDAEGMAACIADLAGNVVSGGNVMDGTEGYNIPEGFTNKIFIPYAAYTGE